MDNKQLTIKDLQKGMMVRVNIGKHSELLIIDYVHIQRKGYIGDSYAVGYDEQSEPVLLTINDTMLAEKKKDQDTHPRIVVCSMCGQQMEIKEWMQANGYKGWEGYEDFMIPHMNRSHQCKCGHLWLSTDTLAVVENILIWIYCS